MRFYFLILTITLASCGEQRSTAAVPGTIDTGRVISATYLPEEPKEKKNEETTSPVTYENKRFRNVSLSTNAIGDYVVQGEGQIFEANFGWVIKDDKKEIRNGYAMTDAGAPEWGKFKFTVKSVNRIKPDSKLQLVLFETSAKDGSRKYELPIELP